MNRPRNPGNKDLPINLHRKLDKRTNKVYYTFRDTRTGKMHGFGTDGEAAIKDANALNSVIYASIRADRLAAIASKKEVGSGITFGKVVARHLKLIETRGLAANTVKNKTLHVRTWERLLGADKDFSSITVTNLAVVLNSYDDRPGARQVMRSTAIDIWKDALHEGWAKENLPKLTRAITAEVVRSRLTLDDFKLIHTEALTLPDKWLARAMEIALVTAQRREDIAAMEFKQRKDATAWVDGDALFVIQQKTGTKVRIPLTVGINGMTVGGVARSCRDSIVTNWLIHHGTRHGMANPGGKLPVDSITAAFAKCRDRAGIVLEDGKTPPTFHEIRSLAIRIYNEQYGNEFAQAIAGHKDAATSALYQDSRGSEWVAVVAR